MNLLLLHTFHSLQHIERHVSVITFGLCYQAIQKTVHSTVLEGPGLPANTIPFPSIAPHLLPRAPQFPLTVPTTPAQFRPYLTLVLTTTPPFYAFTVAPPVEHPRLLPRATRIPAFIRYCHSVRCAGCPITPLPAKKRTHSPHTLCQLYRYARCYGSRHAPLICCDY